MNKKNILFFSCAFLLLFSCAGIRYSPEAATITINANTKYQTIEGWEATIYAADSPGHSVSYPKFVPNLIDQAVNGLGINRVRLEVSSGTENPVDYAAQYLNGEITEYEYKHVPGYAYQIVNDNADPNVINANGFHFTRMDKKVDELLLPMKAKVEANGEHLYINLCVVDFGSATLHSSAPEEYAEFMLALFQHFQSKYGFVPDGVEVELEPHHGTWDASELGYALVAAGNRLKANGYTPDFIAPSHTEMSGALNWFDTMIQIPGARDYLTELSYHRYGGVSDTTLRDIGNRAVTYGVKTAMLEWIGASHQELYSDLSLGRNSDWAQFTLAGIGSNDDGGNYFRIDESNPNNPVVYMGWRTKFLRQYFKFIRSGAVRIRADSNTASAGPLAFINKDGKYVVVIKTDGPTSFSIQGLPAGTYGINYTTNDQYDKNMSSVSISSGQALNSSIPAAGVITFYATKGTTPPPPPPNLNPFMYIPQLMNHNNQGH